TVGAHQLVAYATLDGVPGAGQLAGAAFHARLGIQHHRDPVPAGAYRPGRPVAQHDVELHELPAAGDLVAVGVVTHAGSVRAVRATTGGAVPVGHIRVGDDAAACECHATGEQPETCSMPHRILLTRVWRVECSGRFHS